jgi:hypothetical protein
MARQILPTQLAAGIEAVQLPVSDVPGWLQVELGGIIDTQSLLPSILGAMARSRLSSNRAEPTRRIMTGA